MFCSNCGKEVKGEERYCSNCGGVLITKKSENIKEDSLEIQMDMNEKVVKEEVEEVSTKEEENKYSDNVTDSIKEIINKEKIDKVIDDVRKITNDEVEKIKEVTKEATKEKKFNGLFKNKIVIGVVIVLILAIIGISTISSSTPEKTIEGFIENISDIDLEEALEYTNFESYIEMAVIAGELPIDLAMLSFGLDIDEIKDSLIMSIEQEMYGYFDEIKIVEIEVIEGNKYAEAMVSVEITDVYGYLEFDVMYLDLIKVDGEWLIDINSTNIF